MAFLPLIFDNFEFRDLGHSNFLSFKVLASTHIENEEICFFCYGFKTSALKLLAAGSFEKKCFF